jgi:hypothetical protein
LASPRDAPLGPVQSPLNVIRLDVIEVTAMSQVTGTLCDHALRVDRMTQRTLLATCCLVVAATAAQQALAQPILSPSQISVLQFEDTGSPFVSSSAATSVDQTFASSLGQTLRARGDLATGEVGTLVGSVGVGGTSQVVLFDEITFSADWDGPTTVSYLAGFDGTLSASSQFAQASAQYRVTVYDITDLPNWLETRSFAGLWNETQVVRGASVIADTDIFEDILPSDPRGVYEYDIVRGGSFLADTTRRYGIRISSTSNAFDRSSSDFLNTGTFRFTDLAGATLESGSGVFLSAVPEPSALALLAIGLLPLLGRRAGRLPN